jgi:hypothetical protein
MDLFSLKKSWDQLLNAKNYVGGGEGGKVLKTLIIFNGKKLISPFKDLLQTHLIIIIIYFTTTLTLFGMQK